MMKDIRCKLFLLIVFLLAGLIVHCVVWSESLQQDTEKAREKPPEPGPIIIRSNSLEVDVIGVKSALDSCCEVSVQKGAKVVSHRGGGITEVYLYPFQLKAILGKSSRQGTALRHL